jgi:hypothetical protein
MLPVLSLQDYGIHQTPADLVAEIRALGADDGRAEADGEVSLSDWVRRSETGMGRLCTDVESRGAENLDELIALLEEVEDDLKSRVAKAKGLRARIRAARRQEARRSQPTTPEAIRRLTDLAQRAEAVVEAGVQVLRIYRDGRWQLMAIRADAEGEGDSPVFDDVDQLMKHVLA